MDATTQTAGNPDFDAADATPDRAVGSSASTNDANVDGRSLRRERNRDAVIVALLELIREGDLDPAVTDIADRAGVSHRSVFRYFDDLGDLVRTAIDHEVAAVIPLAIIPNMGEGSLDDRIAAVIESRLRIYDHTNRLGRVARAREIVLPAIEHGMNRITGLFREQLADQFAPELEMLDPTEAADVLDAVLVVVSFESYDLSTRRLGRNDDTVARGWHSALSALLGD